MEQNTEREAEKDAKKAKDQMEKKTKT